MADIKERLAKLARLVSYDEEARSTCEDAIKRIETLEGGDAAKVASTYVGTTGGYFVWGQTPPPGPKTQVKMDVTAEEKEWQEFVDFLGRHAALHPTRGV